MKLRLKCLEIEKLFDRFTYRIDLEGGDGGIKILTAPNGYGKSTILKMIKCFAYGEYFYFIRERFGSIRFIFSDDSILNILHLGDDKEKNQVTFEYKGNKCKITNPLSNPDGDGRLFVVEQYLPYLTRIGNQKWRHDTSGEVFDLMGLLERYGDHPALKRKYMRIEWLELLRKSINVFSISTKRLQSNDEEERKSMTMSSSSLMVSAIADEVKTLIQRAIRQQFEEGRSKETSFPTRLIENLRAGVTPTRDSIIESIKAVQEYEERFARLGLVPQVGATKQLNSHAESSETTGMLVLKTYLEDIREKFSLLDGLAEQLDVFCTSINALVTFKQIETSADSGIVVRIPDRNYEELPLSVLSSGEQHLIVLIGKLVFNTTRESLVLIDEPEISFHPEWQEEFISILEQIRTLNGFSVLVATHSPILIGSRWDKVIELAEQVSC